MYNLLSLRYSNLERHLSLEKCERVVERYSLLDQAKMQYALLLEEGVGVIPTLKSALISADEATKTILEEGWALKKNTKAYRFNDKQKTYLLAKFDHGEATGRKVNAEAVAKEMRRCVGPNGGRMFTVSQNS